MNLCFEISELVEKILLKLDYSSIIQFCLTCRPFTKYLNNKNFWQKNIYSDMSFPVEENEDQVAICLRAELSPFKEYERGIFFYHLVTWYRPPLKIFRLISRLFPTCQGIVLEKGDCVIQNYWSNEYTDELISLIEEIGVYWPEIREEREEYLKEIQNSKKTIQKELEKFQTRSLPQKQSQLENTVLYLRRVCDEISHLNGVQ